MTYVLPSVNVVLCNTESYDLVEQQRKCIPDEAWELHENRVWYSVENEENVSKPIRVRAQRARESEKF